MIILDTDHIVTLKYSDSERFKRLAQRMADSKDQEFVTTAITIEEQMRGWLAQINRLRDVTKQVLAYSELIGLLDFYSYWEVLPFNTLSADQFAEFRSQRIRIGTMDLKIASIAVTQNSVLLTANKRDFENIPELQIEDWIS
jgi:tRNA(fMet)-specific endonuclease VapC